MKRHAVISIIVPALNEEKTIAACLEHTRKAIRTETIVVDGGSIDRTAEIASSSGARVIASAPGRAKQMNRGARAAAGDVLLFLHADTCLPDGYDYHARALLDQEGVAAGAFRLGLNSSLSGLRWIERLANWRSQRLQLPYGDQAIFLKRQRFDDIGGFPEMPIMEDFEFVRRLRRKGRIVTAPLAVTTSARRWTTLGVWRTTLINQAVIAGYCLGVSPFRLARWYLRAQKGRGGALARRT